MSDFTLPSRGSAILSVDVFDVFSGGVAVPFSAVVFVPAEVPAAVFTLGVWWWVVSLRTMLSAGVRGA